VERKINLSIEFLQHIFTTRHLVMFSDKAIRADSEDWEFDPAVTLYKVVALHS
jgi:hypothetical protein